MIYSDTQNKYSISVFSKIEYWRGRVGVSVCP